MKTATPRIDQTAGYRSALTAERARILGGIQGGRDILVLPGGVAVEDQAPLMQEQFVALRRHKIDAHKLKLIEAALDRLNEGEFGICLECGGISDKRLKAVPWAAYCVRCQSAVDAREAADAASALGMIA